MSVKQITEGELLVIRDTLIRMQHEIDSIKNDWEYDYIFNSGVEEGIKESLIIVDSLVDDVILDE